MRFDIFTLFPGMFSGYLTQSILKRAIGKGLVSIHLWDYRDWALGKYRQVDDRPYGGGPGMVLMPEPVVSAVEAVRGMAEPLGQILMMTPQGERLTQPLVKKLATQHRLLLLCGRYEGFDERIKVVLRPYEISIGDYICNGGEVASMVVVDTVLRHVPGVLGDEESVTEESHSRPGLVEYPHYTRPREFRGLEVPEVLLSGNHEAIAAWRQEQSLQRTAERQQLRLKDD
ncbi:MAG TPA: tRNA (guanosine(37)-N1)-methyltransferase TrmD [Gemmatales bacterium]|nr:tRNA (guanosine(37)-N1)-methyltransferase TrmD [Gemmatales bacterium]